MKLLLKGSFAALSFTFFILFTNCKKENEDFIQTCDLTKLDRLNNNWSLSSNQWTSSEIKPYEDCFDMNCIHFNLELQDSIYNLSYLITVESDTLAIDTFSVQESGVFTSEHCHRSNINADGGHYPGGFTNNGIIKFFPDSGQPYSSNFKSDAFYPLWIGYRFGDRGTIVYLK